MAAAPPDLHQPHGLDDVRAHVLRSIAATVRSVGVGEHEVTCDLHGDVAGLEVVLRGPSALGGVRQALGVRVLDAIHGMGRTFGPVDVVVDAERDLRP